MFVELDEYWLWNWDQGRHMPALSLISGMQAGLGPLSLCHSSVPALQRSQSRHIPFVSARRSLFTFHLLDIPIKAADYLLASSSSPSTGHIAVSHLSLSLFVRAAVPILLFSPVVLFAVYLLSCLCFWPSLWHNVPDVHLVCREGWTARRGLTRILQAKWGRLRNTTRACPHLNVLFRGEWL